MPRRMAIWVPLRLMEKLPSKLKVGKLFEKQLKN